MTWTCWMLLCSESVAEGEVEGEEVADRLVEVHLLLPQLRRRASYAATANWPTLAIAEFTTAASKP
eukprot:3405408-Amphidinium_carterae.1